MCISAENSNVPKPAYYPKHKTKFFPSIGLNQSEYFLNIVSALLY
jgi:hypothetical protein